MYKELDKYKTGNKMQQKVYYTNTGGKDIYLDTEVDEYEFNLGDILNEFIEHKNKSFLKKTYYHKDLTRIYKKILNKISIKIGF